MEKTQTRLNKYLSEVGYCSRREADRLIDEGRVTVNGVVPEMGTKVTEDDEICVNGQLIVNKEEENVYLAFYKPVGIECTTNTTVRDNIVDYINYPTRIFPIGRLDKDSEGLILMTNDGDIVNKILRQKNNHEKEYIVTVNKPLTDRFIQRMGAGVPILDTVTKKCRVEAISKTVFRIFLTQGLNRQIRRMCEYFDYDVVALKRIRIINISLDIPVGTYRNLKQEELDELNRLIEPSVMTEEASLNRNEESQQSIRRRMTTGKDSGRRDTNGKYPNRRDADNGNDRYPKRNFDREKNESNNKPKEVKNERLRDRRRGE